MRLAATGARRRGTAPGLRIPGAGAGMNPHDSAAALAALDRICTGSLLDASDQVIYFKDLDSRFVRVSLGMARRHRRSQAEVIGLTDADLFASTHAAEALADEREIIRTGKPVLDKEECERLADRTMRWVSTSKFPLRDDSGAIVGTFGVSHDITRRVLAEQEMTRLAEASAAATASLARVEAQLRSVLNGSIVAIAQYTTDLRYRYINPAGERLRGRPLHELVGRTDRELAPGVPGADSWEAALRRVLATAAPTEHEFGAPLEDGSEGWFHTTLSPEIGADGAVIGVLTSTRDVTTSRRAERALAHQAMHDPVTGLANRYLLMDRLDQALLRLARIPGKVVLLFVDLDQFKAVNDAYGHEVGDRLLVELSRRLSALRRREDTVARLGGDEFVVLCESLEDEAGMREIAARLLGALGEPFDLGEGLQVRLSASIGVSITDDPQVRAADLLRDADRAMYRVKQQGRNGFHVFDAATDEDGVLQVEVELQQALVRGEFTLVYQPMLSLEDGRLLGFEALLRWEHPRRGTLLPGDFLGTAERLGLMGRLGAWVLDTACARLAAWSADPAMLGSGVLGMAVNVSGSQLRTRGFAEQVRATLAAHGLAPHLLRLEISERDLVHESRHLEATLRELSEVGVQLVVDDFGASVTSLARLSQIPISVVKLGRFGKMRQREIVAAVIATAHGLGMSVLGAGIENAEQLAELSALSCDDGQGFLLGRPLDQDSAEALLRGGGQVAAVS